MLPEGCSLDSRVFIFQLNHVIDRYLCLHRLNHEGKEHEHTSERSIKTSSGNKDTGTLGTRNEEVSIDSTVPIETNPLLKYVSTCSSTLSNAVFLSE